MIIVQFLWLIGLVLIPGALQAQEAPVAALVQETLAKQGTADFFVVLRDDPTPGILAEAGSLGDHQARRAFIVERLQTDTFRSQNNLGYWLLQQGADYQHFWIVNQILVRRGTAELLRQIQARKDVRRIDANPPVKLTLPPPQAAAPQEPTALEWNIARIKADQVWTKYGVRGAGIVVAVQDTGVRWEHEALKNQYRGWNGATADHTYSWHDAIHTGGSTCGADAPAPCDDYGHGTHVTGTIAGYTVVNQIGVAPGAKWIACRNMNNGVGTPATYLECFQWFLAPGGDASQAPHIISNSWGCPPEEGCNQDTLESVVTTVRSAGIMVVVSNGNNGPGCASTYDPPAIYRDSFSVGATDSGDNLASLSSRGPVTYKGETYRKPDISAPGINVRSSYFNGGYATFSGTSMAAPHIAGAAALLWSGLPRLRGQIDATERLLERTARPKNYTTCGDGPGVPNNGYGYGIVDVLGAYRQAWASAVSSYQLLLME